MGEKAVAAVNATVAVDDGDGMHCPDHPYRANPGGICAFCLQEKLGKLVSSSKSSTSFFPVPHSSSSSPSFRSTASSTPAPPTAPSSRSRMSFLSTSIHSHRREGNAKGSQPTTRVKSTLNRSNSVMPSAFQPMDSPRRRWFWSFLSQNNTTNKDRCKEVNENVMPKKSVVVEAAEEEGSPGGSTTSTTSSFGRKVARSRSVGCGSRSFSGDFLERISTGLGDCALRRVESQREPKIVLHRASTSAADNGERNGQEQRVKCGGIFGGFGERTSSTSASYWLPEVGSNGKLPPMGAAGGGGHHRDTATHGRGKGWGWALASPIRAFRPLSKAYAMTSSDNAAPLTPNRRLVTVKTINSNINVVSVNGGGGGGGRPVSPMVVARG